MALLREIEIDSTHRAIYESPPVHVAGWTFLGVRAGAAKECELPFRRCLGSVQGAFFAFIVGTRAPSSLSFVNTLASIFSVSPERERTAR